MFKEYDICPICGHPLNDKNFPSQKMTIEELAIISIIFLSMILIFLILDIINNISIGNDYVLMGLMAFFILFLIITTAYYIIPGKISLK